MRWDILLKWYISPKWDSFLPWFTLEICSTWVKILFIPVNLCVYFLVHMLLSLFTFFYCFNFEWLITLFCLCVYFLVHILLSLFTFFYCFNFEWLITLFKDFAYCTHWGAHSALMPLAKFYFPIHAKHRIFFLPG